MRKVGFTIGKFAPLHKGHQYLIEKMVNEMDVSYVVVYETDILDIPLERRAIWIKTLYEGVNILYAKNPPEQYGLDKESIDIQMRYLAEILGDIKPTHFYSSEKYGAYVADYLKIEEVLVDRARVNVPISATKVRGNIEEYKKYLSDVVYEDLK